MSNHSFVIVTSIQWGRFLKGDFWREKQLLTICWLNECRTHTLRSWEQFYCVLHAASVSRTSVLCENHENILWQTFSSCGRHLTSQILLTYVTVLQQQNQNRWILEVLVCFVTCCSQLIILNVLHWQIFQIKKQRSGLNASKILPFRKCLMINELAGKTNCQWLEQQ